MCSLLKHIALHSLLVSLRLLTCWGMGDTMANLAKRMREDSGYSLCQGSSHAYSPASIRDLREEPKRVTHTGLWPPYTAHLQSAG